MFRKLIRIVHFTFVNIFSCTNILDYYRGNRPIKGIRCLGKSAMQGIKRKALIIYCACLLAISVLIVIDTIKGNGDKEEQDSDNNILKLREKMSEFTDTNHSNNVPLTSGSIFKNLVLMYSANSSVLLPNLTAVNNRNESERNTPLYLQDIFPHVQYPPFQPDAVSDFPTTVGQQPRIPHIIHQTFKSKMLPYRYALYAKQMYEMNPKWTYYFWTDVSARKLIQDRYPELLNDWDSFNKSISKGDFLRYIVLHEFGGAYIDLDVKPLRPLDNMTMKYACVIPTEPFEHNVFIYDTQVFMNNAIMFCRPKHPFFKQMIYRIRDTLDLSDVTDGTGPGFVTRNFIEYNNIDVYSENRTKTEFTSNSPYFYKGDLPETHNDAIYVPNTHYFSDQIDIRDRKESFRRTCRKFVTQPYLTKRACIEMRRRGMVRKNTQYSFLRHRWHHFWMNSDNYKEHFDIHIREIAPKCIIYGEYKSALKRTHMKDFQVEKSKVLRYDSDQTGSYQTSTNVRPSLKNTFFQPNQNGAKY